MSHWRNSAACRDGDADLFFPTGNKGPALLQIEQAKAVCQRCPVMQDCGQWALDTDQEAGVWGGLSEDERRATRQQAMADKPKRRGGRPPAGCGTPGGYTRHKRLGEEACPPCHAAMLEDSRRRRADKRYSKPKKGRKLAPCGTNTAYKRHQRIGEPIDDACREAHNEMNRHFRKTGSTKVPA